ncbi:1-aminocyclopropane-1-carboxylate deaminase/D-cysteine desulfhydrase [Bosea sp. 2KB_26]|uniref:1-aminocyclopropane-1-carboxylate deaminase/D-cysteine desulfhydrase n=1 Tax=Bosea sp. 2KB_26 TaxID=3237475 RepID=UPI003F910B19
MLSAFPRIDLVGGPTALEPMRRIGPVTGHPQLWIKRDDCMPLAFGGNKVRSLEFWIGEALARKSDMLVVAGGLPSNQCRLAAAAAAKIGLDMLVLYAGDASAPLRGNALLTERLGAEIRLLGPVGEEERGRLARQTIAELEAAGRRPYLIGDPVLGALGYVRAAQELSEQAQALSLDLRHIVLPGSMGVTEAGMIFGAAVLGLPWTFHLVSVEYDACTLRRRLDAILRDLAGLVGRALPSECLDRIRIDLGQLGKGYGVPTAASVQAAALFARHEALMLEQTYVAKTFAGLLKLAEDHVIPPDEAACVLHTGGTPAIFEQSGSD